MLRKFIYNLKLTLFKNHKMRVIISFCIMIRKKPLKRHLMSCCILIFKQIIIDIVWTTVLEKMRLIQKLIVIIFLYLIKLQLKLRAEEEQIDELGESELEMFFKGKKLSASQAYSVQSCIPNQISPS